jgi:hypothetical protein
MTPMTDHEAFEFVLGHVRKVFPRINALYLNNKGTADELALQRAVSLIKTQHTDVGLSAKRSPRGDYQRALRRIYQLRLPERTALRGQ